MTFEFWKQYVLSCSPFIAFVTGTTALAALSLYSGGSLSGLAVPFFVFFLLFAAAYGLYSALTIDARNWPSALDEGHVITVSSIIIFLGSISLAYWNLWNVPFLMVLIAGTLVSAFTSSYWWGTLFFKPATLAVIPIMAALTVDQGTVANIDIDSGSLTYLVLSVFFSGAVYVLLNSISQVAIDEKRGDKSLPLLFGSKVSLLVSLGLTMFAFIFSISLLRPLNFISSPLSWQQFAIQVLWGGGFFILFYLHYSMVPRSVISDSEENIRPDVKGIVRALVLIRCAEAAAFNSELLPVVLVIALLFEFSQVWESNNECAETTMTT